MKPTEFRRNAVLVAIDSEHVPHVTREHLRHLDSAAFNLGWKLAIEAVTEKVTFALVGETKAVSRAIRTWEGQREGRKS